VLEDTADAGEAAEPGAAAGAEPEVIVEKKAEERAEAKDKKD